jgi:hypothetical protein
MRHTKSDLRRSIDNLIKRNSPIKTDVSDLLQSKGFKDPAYNSLILQILEAKALDCLCSGYSKQNTQAQIAQALNEINQRLTRFIDMISINILLFPSIEMIIIRILSVIHHHKHHLTVTKHHHKHHLTVTIHHLLQYYLLMHLLPLVLIHHQKHFLHHH